jgi:hypothetical protein
VYWSVCVGKCRSDEISFEILHDSDNEVFLSKTEQR